MVTVVDLTGDCFVLFVLSGVSGGLQGEATCSLLSVLLVGGRDACGEFTVLFVLLFGHEAMLAYDFLVDEAREEVEFDLESCMRLLLVVVVEAVSDVFSFSSHTLFSL